MYATCRADHHHVYVPTGQNIIPKDREVIRSGRCCQVTPWRGYKALLGEPARNVRVHSIEYQFNFDPSLVVQGQLDLGRDSS